MKHKLSLSIEPIYTSHCNQVDSLNMKRKHALKNSLTKIQKVAKSCLLFNNKTNRNVKMEKIIWAQKRKDGEDYLGHLNKNDKWIKPIILNNFFIISLNFRYLYSSLL